MYLVGFDSDHWAINLMEPIDLLGKYATLENLKIQFVETCCGGQTGPGNLDSGLKYTR